MVIAVCPMNHAVFERGKIVSCCPQDDKKSNHDERDYLEHHRAIEATRFILALGMRLIRHEPACAGERIASFGCPR